MAPAERQPEATQTDVAGQAEEIRRRCIQAALEGHEVASTRGVCHEGAWEIAVGAMRAVDLQDVPDAGIQPQTAHLAATFAGDGAPAAGSAAAATGALAAGLVQWTASLSSQPAFAERASEIQQQADVLQQNLAVAARIDAELVDSWIEARRRGTKGPTVDVATDSVVKIARACGRVAVLAAEVARHGVVRARPDAAVARDLALASAEAALSLAHENLRHADAEQDVTRLHRTVWRVQLVVDRTRAESDEV